MKVSAFLLASGGTLAALALAPSAPAPQDAALEPSALEATPEEVAALRGRLDELEGAYVGYGDALDAYRDAFDRAFPEEPPVLDPPTDPPLDPPTDVEAGCRIARADLVEWTFAPVEGAGRPASIPAYGSGETMHGFLFRPADGDAYTGPHGWKQSKPEHPVVARDFIVDGYRPWGGNAKGVARELVEWATIRGHLRTGRHSEHGDYVGAQGGGDPSAGYSIARRHVLYEDCPGAALQVTTRDRWIHGGPGPGKVPALECTDPATCFDDAAPIVLEHVVARRCSVEFPAAVVSLHSPQSWDLGGAMPRAFQGTRLERVVLDNRSTVRAGDRTYATLLLIAGKQWIELESCDFLRDETAWTGGESGRALVKFGDQYAADAAAVWEGDGAPAVEPGGTIEVLACRFWTAEPARVEVLAAAGTALSWRACELLEGSAPVALHLNGDLLGSVAEDHELLVE